MAEVSRHQPLDVIDLLTDIFEDQLYNLTQHIYNNLTSIYAALYKTTSPLTLDWRTQEVSDMLGNDQQLIKRFCDIKTEMMWFRKPGHFLSIMRPSLPSLTHGRCGKRSAILRRCSLQDTCGGE